MSRSPNLLYTARTRTTGGRENGVSRSSDGRLDVKLATPGAPRIGTNPEQLFAASWSASFVTAIAEAARKLKITLPTETTIEAEVDLSVCANGYVLSGRVSVSLPGVERTAAEGIVEEAQRTCPYSKATRGNIDVAIKLV